jgi:uncharacterized protein YqjF (DUF2071 family)
MRTIFRDCFLVNFAIRPEALRPLVPPPLQPDIHGGNGYLSIVIADMERMRPAFLPPLCGVSYIQVVYRVVVRYGPERGVYFIRSDANNRVMALLGDWFTFFRFHHAPARLERQSDAIDFELRGTEGGAADIRSRFVDPGDALPPSSAFAGLDHARTFLVELFVAFGVLGGGDVRAVRIERGRWNVRVVRDTIAEYRFMGPAGPFGPGATRLDSVFHVTDVPYHWFRLGRAAP